jgi:small GTP-binding protein
MPTNLPPEFYAVEKEYRAAKTVREKITTLQDLISTIPKHKGTDKIRADYRKRLSKLKASEQSKKSVSKRETPYTFDREGAGQAVVIGPTNVGKSALVDRLTNATPEVSEAPFTTWKPTPGMMPMENIQIQLIDTPPLNQEFVEPEMMDAIRRSDIILLMVDLNADPFQQLEDSIALLQEHRIVPLHMKDRIAGKHRLTFVPVIVLVNKYDNEASNEDYEIFTELLEEDWPLLPISALTGRNLKRMQQVLYDELDIMRIYSKPPLKEPDKSSPFVMKKGGTVEDFAVKVHHDFYEKLKSARVWGSSAFEGQMVSRDYVLHDGDVVELRL